MRYALKDWKTYVMAVAYSCMNLGLGSVSGFLPTIIKGEQKVRVLGARAPRSPYLLPRLPHRLPLRIGLGYSNADAQLFTVPPVSLSAPPQMLGADLSLP